MNLESGSSYELSHMVLKSYNFRYHMHTSGLSEMRKLPDLKIQSVAGNVLKQSKLTMKIIEFTQVRNIDVFKICPSCSKKFKLVNKDKRFVWCECGAKVKRTRFALVKPSFQGEVEFLLKEDEFLWETIFSSAFSDPGPFTTKKDVENFLTDIANMNITVDIDKKLVINVAVAED